MTLDVTHKDIRQVESLLSENRQKEIMGSWWDSRVPTRRTQAGA